MNAKNFANKNNHKFLDVCTNEIFYGIIGLKLLSTKEDKDFLNKKIFITKSRVMISKKKYIKVFEP